MNERSPAAASASVPALSRPSALALPTLAGLLCAALVLLTPACDPGDAGREVIQTVLEVTDSEGVRTILLGNLDELSAARIIQDLVASTREQGIELFNATMALFLDGGGLAVANAGTMEVLLLAGDGSLARRVGRQGEGPGEFMEVTSLVKTPAGFLVYDARLGRISEFTEAGDFCNSRALLRQSGFAGLRPLAPSGAGSARMKCVHGRMESWPNLDRTRRSRSSGPSRRSRRRRTRPSPPRCWVRMKWYGSACRVAGVMKRGRG